MRIGRILPGDLNRRAPPGVAGDSERSVEAASSPAAGGASAKERFEINRLSSVPTMAEAFIGLLQGGNFGKLIVRVAS